MPEESEEKYRRIYFSNYGLFPEVIHIRNEFTYMLAGIADYNRNECIITYTVRKPESMG